MYEGSLEGVAKVYVSLLGSVTLIAQSRTQCSLLAVFKVVSKGKRDIVLVNRFNCLLLVSLVFRSDCVCSQPRNIYNSRDC